MATPRNIGENVMSHSFSNQSKAKVLFCFRKKKSIYANMVILTKGKIEMERENSYKCVKRQ